VVGVLSEGWRCRAPVAARTLSSGFLSFPRAFFFGVLLPSIGVYFRAPHRSRSRE
jgi:hypothetical protein